jgi:hypothetical protein
MSENLPASILARLLTLAKQRGDDYSPCATHIRPHRCGI